MKLKVLAVDDEKPFLTLLRTALDAEGFELSTAQTVRQFWELDAIGDFDLYLIDVTLNDGNGFSIVRDLRQKTDKGIILLSGRTSETDQVLGLEVGADDYVSKPFRMRELAARMNAVWRRSGRGGSSVAADAQTLRAERDAGHDYDYEFDGYRLRIAARTLWGCQDQEIPLTSAEFNLMVALLKRRGQVLDRDQLMNAVKGQDWECYDRAVDGLISRLRRKIPPPEDRSHYIRTVHGVGYVFAK